MLKKFENCICAIDKTIFKQDEYCFFVLMRILEETCTLTITDGKRLVICYSCPPYPVWIWLPDNATEQEKDRAYREIKSNFGFNNGSRFNMKYFLAEYFLDRAKKEGFPLDICTNMFTYNCETPIAPVKSVDGYLKAAEIEDLESAAEFIRAFHKEVNMDKTDMETYRKKAEAFISERSFFFWVDGHGEKVACCSYRDSMEKSSIGSVFTKAEKRRQGYASALVYQVTKLILERKKIPTLYTDADYEASNACYVNIGYRLKGNLCTIG